VGVLLLAALLSVSAASCGATGSVTSTDSGTSSETMLSATAEGSETGTQTETSGEIGAQTAAAAQTTTQADTAVLSSYNYLQSAPCGDAVDDSYFSDAVLIGDSRIEGMFLYGTLSSAVFFCGKGATVANVKTKVNASVNGADMTIMDALAQTDFSKVYISLGLNELGWANMDAYQTDYGELIDQIRQLRPDALIYIQDIIPVNPEVCAQRGQATYINNERIAQYNSLLYELAREKQVILLKVSEVFADENGALPADDTADGIHLNASCYQQWCDYLRTHTVHPEDYSPPAGQAPDTADGGSDPSTQDS